MLKSYAIYLPKYSNRYKICAGLLALFILSALMRFSIHPSGGHTFRQADTIGMCIAFAEDLQTQGFQGLKFLLYPRLLEKGLLDGINAAEFPLLNVLGGLFFLGGSPRAGVLCTSLLILALNLWAGYTFLPRFLRFWKVEVSNILGATLWLCGGSVAAQATAIMPEGLAFPLVIIGMVLILEATREATKKRALGALLCSLGVAVKPTVIIALAATIPLILVSKEHRPRRIQILFTLAASLVFPIWWYTLHAQHIISFAQGPQIVPLAHLAPLGKLQEAGFEGIRNLVFREGFFGEGQFPIYFGWFFITTALALKEYLSIGSYLLAVIATISLDGLHLYQHAYYFIGAAACSFPLMARILGAFQDRPLLKNMTFIFILWGLLYETRTNLWIWARDSQLGTQYPWTLGTQANQLIPRTDHLVTDDGNYPWKMLYIGRSGTKLTNEFLELCDNSLYSKLTLTLVTSNHPHFINNRCGVRNATTMNITDHNSQWYLTRVGPKVQF